jgi:predicted nucleic acid-binding protein
VNVYADSSALVKRYAPERACQLTQVFIASASRLATSDLTRIEVVSALYRKARWNNPPELTLIQVNAAYMQLDADWQQIMQIPVDEDLQTIAEQVVGQYTLRGYDAVHLASALTMRDLIGEPITVATFDLELWSACQAEGLGVWPANILVALQQP